MDLKPRDYFATLGLGWRSSQSLCWLCIVYKLKPEDTIDAEEGLELLPTYWVVSAQKMSGGSLLRSWLGSS